MYCCDSAIFDSTATCSTCMPLPSALLADVVSEQRCWHGIAVVHASMHYSIATRWYVVYAVQQHTPVPAWIASARYARCCTGWYGTSVPYPSSISTAARYLPSSYCHDAAKLLVTVAIEIQAYHDCCMQQSWYAKQLLSRAASLRRDGSC